ncbi:unnamed protein product [Symbiodinium natans]|uniref:Uncharacterized protein n=1 Tax=Symbiodinium natans TaxID=878477 RepID=A0A812NQ56_9DINO|nr:unnamed protein product [Symbiodinium natans]
MLKRGHGEHKKTCLKSGARFCPSTVAERCFFFFVIHVVLAQEKDKKKRCTSQVVHPQWRVHSDKLRNALQVSRAWCGWTGRPEFRQTSAQLTDRVKDLLDVAVAWRLRKQGLPLWVGPEAQECLKDFFVDVSQSVGRTPWGKCGDNVLCFTKSTVLYSFQRGSLVHPLEMARMLGWPDNWEAPAGVPLNKIKEMLGNSVALPSLGSVVWAWRLVQSRRM